ncbi:M28 family peptidase [Bizionia sediminis]|uniref:M28 family peptidase n=1 Tax=Bizionia sediminis TaxID=1737064 RepID=A0ABW5KQT3_9FLAO
MKTLLIASAFTLIGSCATTRYSEKIENLKNTIQVTDSLEITRFAKTIKADELKTHLYTFASHQFEGRKTGEPGQKTAANFLKDYYIAQQIASPLEGSNYFQTVPESFLPTNIKASENILAYIKGTEKPEEVIIISAHLDHLGYKNNEVYNGADDNGSGTTALMEMAQAFKIAENEGFSPKRSILFLHLTAEELGLYGARYYVNHPVFELHKTIANLNIDMIGRVDEKHENNPDYLYLIGADRISKELHFISEKINNTLYQINLDYTFNAEDDKNRYYFRSDHYLFAEQNIPVIFYFNGEHADYHETTDTADKINYPLLARRTKLIFATAWYLANMDKPLIHNSQL